MDSRVRNLVMLVVLLVWAFFMGAQVLRGQPPDPPLWGIPGGVYVVLYRPWQLRQQEPTPAPAVTPQPQEPPQ